MAVLSDQLRRPQLGRLMAGQAPEVTQDALGRRLVRSNLLPKKFGDYRPVGGTPQAKGVETFIPRALDAAKQAGVHPSVATNPAMMKRLFANRMGRGSPGPMKETVKRMMMLRGGT